MIQNTILLTGPLSYGKTSIIYAIANELEYKIIEVNCITIKTGKDLNNLIGEATQSQCVKLNDINHKKYTKLNVLLLFEQIDKMLEYSPSIIKTIINFLNNPMI